MTAFFREPGGRTRRHGYAVLAFGAAVVLLAACSTNPTTPRPSANSANGRSSTTTAASFPPTNHQGSTTSTPGQSTTTTSLRRVTATTTPRLTTTTASGAPQPRGVAQRSHGPVEREATVASIGNVMAGSSSHLSFTLNLRNTGTLPYNCGALKAQARTGHTVSAIVGPLLGSSGLPCPSPDDTIAPGKNETFAFYIPLVGGPAQDVIVLPYGSYASRVVWAVSGA